MYHMKKASVRDLRYRFTEIERALNQGHAVEITKRKRLIGAMSRLRFVISTAWP